MEEVGKAVGGNTEVCLRERGILISKVNTITANDRKAVFARGIESCRSRSASYSNATKGEDFTSCANNDIKLLNCPIDKFNAVGQNLFDRCRNEIALTNDS